MDFTGLYSLRDYQESDKSFVLSTFLRGLYYGDSWYSEIPKDIFMDNYKKIAEQIMNRSIVTIACLSDEPDVILGYSMLSGNLSTIHWVYVKKIWRKRGIARRLLPQYPKSATHLTDLGKLLLKEKFPNTIFNPFSIGA